MRTPRNHPRAKATDAGSRPNLCPATGTGTRIALLLALFLVVTAPCSGAEIVGPASIVRAYVEALKAGDWERAESLWVPHVPAMAQRLGISYRGVRAKYDCASPLYRSLDAIRDGSIRVSVGAPQSQPSFIEIPVTLTIGDGEIATSYFVVAFDNEWRLASRLDVLTRGWPVRETRYAVVHYRDSGLINDHALAEVDRFTDSVARYLGVSDERLAFLAQKKIDYYICHPHEVEQLTGFATPGLTDLPSDAIITSHLPHYHELVHLLANFAIEDADLYTLPCLQEGLAVSLGGRWGKSPEVMLQLGAFVIENELASVDDVLTYEGFHGSGLPPDLSYAASGVLVRSLTNELGVETFLQLYRRLSGTSDAVRAVTADSVRRALQDVADTPWSAVTAGCRTVASARASSGVEPVRSSTPEAEPLVLHSGSFLGTIWLTDSVGIFEIHANGDERAGAILFACAAGAPESSYQSRLFQQQLPGQPYHGECLGLVFDTLEVGLYDYRTDNLLGKFAAGFSFGPGIWNPAERMIRFSISRRLLADEIPWDRVRLTAR